MLEIHNVEGLDSKTLNITKRKTKYYNFGETLALLNDLEKHAQ